ncbi:MAG: DUF6492 family protein [Acidimicrobiales bacterium]
MANGDAHGVDRADAWLMVTPTYRGDREQFALLTESFQRYAPVGLIHQVIVDRADVPLFERFRHDRMRLTTAEDVLPGRVRKVTVAGRSAWVGTRFPPVRNWIAQQLMKIAAACASDRPFVLFADSDVVFLRPFGIDRLTDGRQVALSRVRAEFDDLPHWRAASSRLLGLSDPGSLATVNYVSNLIPWRRDVARAMVARVEAHHRGGWAAAVARELRFSEYTLYGVFAEAVLGLDAAGHYAWDDPILNLCWDEPMGSRTEIDKLLERTQDEHIGAMFHSKAGFDKADLRAAVEAWWSGAPA